MVFLLEEHLLTLRALRESQIIQNKGLNYWPDNWGQSTSIMGVLNITPDSFSDGGKYFDEQKALRRAEECLTNGADVLDIGGQSTRPGATLIGADEELRRVIPVLKEIRINFPNSILSIDTFHSKVAEIALENGANWINDVSGGKHDLDILKIIAMAGCPYVINHCRGNSLTMNQYSDYNNVVEEVINELLISTEVAISKGVNEKQIIWDPGIGFAKNTNQNLLILKNLKAFKDEENFMLED